MRREKVAVCRASYPDSGETCYPGAYQWFDVNREEWRWLFMGCGGQYKRKEKDVHRQAQMEKQIPNGSRVRFIHVKSWRRIKGGWQAIIDPKYTVEVIKERRRIE